MHKKENENGISLSGHTITDYTVPHTHTYFRKLTYTPVKALFEKPKFSPTSPMKKPGDGLLFPAKFSELAKGKQAVKWMI